MGRRTSTSLLVVALLVSLLAHRLPVSCARHVVVLKKIDGLTDRDVNLAKKPASGSADDLGAKKGTEARKLFDSFLAGSAAPRRRLLPASPAAAATESRPRTVEMRAAGKHADPVTEMYDMLRRDYASKASRRRPINNGEPLQDEELGT